MKNFQFTNRSRTGAMIIFLNEEAAYRSWLTRHRDGFVVDGLRKPTRKPLVLHRASCVEIRQSSSKRTHWTTGRHFKACSTQSQELVEWVQAESSRAPEFCPQCVPSEDLNPAELEQRGLADDRLTRLEGELLESVLDVAVLHLDQPDQSDYAYTVTDLAQAVGKTPAQISQALARLIQSGHLQLDEGEAVVGEALAAGLTIYPTAQSLQATAAFASDSKRSIAAELRRLMRR